MFKGSSCTASKDVANSSEEENKGACDTLSSMDVSNNKGSQVDEKEPVLKKLSKTSDDPDEEGGKRVMAFLILPQDQENEQNHEAEIADKTPRIGNLYSDLSINVLLKLSRSDYGIISALNSSFRSLIRSGELYRLRREMGIVEHWIYFSCNLHQWEAYDPNRGRWMKLPKMPRNDCFMCSDKESLGVGTDLLVFGRDILGPMVYGYSLLTNSWSTAVEMNIPRCLFGSASNGGIAILAGGVDPVGNVLNVAELYNSETRKWETLPNMHKKRRMSSGVFMDGKFYVIGGIAEDNKTEITSGEEYDLETKTWREIPDMFPPRGGEPNIGAPPLLAVVNNVLYSADCNQHIVRRYEKESNKWVTIGNLPERTSSIGGWGIGFRACGNRLMVIGGLTTESSGVTEINSWIPSEHPLQWNILERRRIGSFVSNCAVMGC
ncbi:hypothetical protein LR48_Vigan01g281900 [Vigna angularis]|uniref:F-box/kelch-repeat protein n=2 Tax=Phaseolus angularis TaxID=3914 RepID=A0A0L9TRQ2_PHAAN|nr:F-box/kelch-repeat protein SKIP11 [Vigna angularis]KAG2407718.1 F-box/kelch-repeat protein [Vigna angularis]KOM33263.1 hypothetical protein LR48_Vigan01g281900 [Vigna angularis]BAT76593.1 hypothetical protein VIGAN_01462100 [Vigna angularis var. angularis]